MRLITPNRTHVRALARDGRRRAEALREALPDAPLNDALHVVGDLREQVEPLVGRALHRRSRRRRPMWLLAGLLIVAALGGIAYVLWKRDGEQPAYLVHEPEQPDVSPASPITPAGEAPSSPAPTSGTPDIAPGAPPAGPLREAVGAGNWSPPSNTTADEHPAPRTRSGRPFGLSLPSAHAAVAPFAAARDLLPGRGSLGLPRFPR